ncbi:hypothetical protein EV356DRAFT_485845 [Viridothelium virens]|uniref:NB-ARC domain-containing protein n=1 Tax=Viridothelium virens TaxID=1048519 RepID=A0A6A6H823_VIRVR|nr:hypothetical protein EV356DRAFT_485845 [Viridothelium virens]
MSRQRDRPISLSFDRPSLARNIVAGVHTTGGTTSFHFDSDNLQEPLKPDSNIPFRQDQDFVNRGDILTRVAQRCSQPASRAALVGLGGVGKSQLAIEYAHHVRKQSPETWVFWVYAATTARIEGSYKNIADMIDLPGRQQTSASLMRLVCNWLTREANGKWLVIVDNVDDEVMIDPQNGEHGESSSFASFLPQSSNGAMPITSRNMDVARKLVGYHKDIIIVPEMDQQEANELLQKKLSGQLGELGPQLLNALDYTPLAITQAAAYINDLHSRDLVLEYLKEIRTIRERNPLLENISPDVRRDEYSSNSVFATWQISFEYIRAKRPSAANLLSFMSFFHRQNIPEFMLYHYEDKNGDEQDNVDDEKEANVNGDENSNIGGHRKRDSNDSTTFFSHLQRELRADIRLLLDFSLIKGISSRDEFEMHRLVQSATRMWLRSSSAEEKWWGVFTAAMARDFPYVNYESWSRCRALIPHVQYLTEKEPLGRRQILQRADVLNKAECYANAQGLLVQAEAMIRICLRDRAKELGDEDLNTLTSFGALGSILSEQGKHEAAEDLNLRVLAGREKGLGKDHPKTLLSMSNLAVTLHRLGKYDEAEDLNRRALVGREKVFGKEHPDTLVSVGNLATTLCMLRKYNEAEALNWRALAGREKVLGKEHPDTLSSLANLGYSLSRQQKSGAEEMSRRALEGREKALGKEHPSTLWSARSLAFFLGDRRHYDESIYLFERACDGFERVLGASHPDTRACRGDFTDLLQARKNDRGSAVKFGFRRSMERLMRKER